MRLPTSDREVRDETVHPRPQGQVLIGDEVDNTGESTTRRSAYLVTEPDQPAADETPTPGEK